MDKLIQDAVTIPTSVLFTLALIEELVGVFPYWGRGIPSRQKMPQGSETIDWSLLISRQSGKFSNFSNPYYVRLADRCGMILH